MSTPLVALITAGSAGLGAAAAKAFVQAGMRVVVNYSSNAERAENLVKELEKLSPLTSQASRRTAIAIKADVAKRADVERLVEEGVTAMGQLDVVFSNHGWTQLRTFNDLNDNVVEEDWDRCFNMNVKSHLFLMHAAKKHLDATEGVFISTASMAGVKPSGSSLAYAVTKAAQLHLMKCLATIASPKIRVNSVSPGLLLTDWGMSFPEERREAMRNATKLKRFVTVEDVAEQVLTFAKNRSMTGVNAYVDSGFSL